MGQEGLGCVWDTRILVSLEQRVQVQMRQGWAAWGVWGSAHTPRRPLTWQEEEEEEEVVGQGGC